jgi:hypothetical protein
VIPLEVLVRVIESPKIFVLIVVGDETLSMLTVNGAAFCPKKVPFTTKEFELTAFTATIPLTQEHKVASHPAFTE